MKKSRIKASPQSVAAEHSQVAEEQMNVDPVIGVPASTSESASTAAPATGPETEATLPPKTSEADAEENWTTVASTVTETFPRTTRHS